MPRKYEKVQKLLPEVQRLNAEGYTHRQIAEKLGQCQAECGSTYGYRRVHIWLERNGVLRNPKTVLRVMNKYNLLSVVRRKQYKKRGDSLHRNPNLLNRNFAAERPNQKWATDIS